MKGYKVDELDLIS